MSRSPTRPAHLDPSELGTKEYVESSSSFKEFRLTTAVRTVSDCSWDRYYQNDLDNGSDHDHDDKSDQEDRDDTAPTDPPEPSELESWFDDVGAPEKTLAFLTSTTFPLAPNYTPVTNKTPNSTTKTATDGHSPTSTTTRGLPTVLDLGTGNGSALFALRLEGGYAGRMVGVDYSLQSIELARKLWRQYSASTSASASSDSNRNSNPHSDPSSNTKSSSSATSPAPATTTDISEASTTPSETTGGGNGDITFQVLDLINDTPTEQAWWPIESDGFDLVLDKGTFDAISLSSATVSVGPGPSNDSDGALSVRERRVCELYPAKVLSMVKPGGFLLVTSCNWTEEEVISWFTSATLPRTEESGGRFEVYDTIKYPVYEFGGQKGQGVASVCFRRIV
ncbi:hypothetical protein A1O1_08486 [Capronia coronata CBS 617.96]|uniref:Protein-lysine N-methyltransferase EFM4 n=1 Tax=Capronia coronata CBS 617.96 TaxID=1182541 RepID=W9XIN5_9EURO|nr:uncharacterized protein A1O1_08486 [Capronia coronata CBS 617.96]EXJ80342.1 hypothetical protein A1O1_08486 [Capronia coronata CBS 617.96]